MWTRHYSAFYPNVCPKAIWRLWTAINDWPQWHSDLEYCRLSGEFAVGNHFILKPKGGPAVKIDLVDIKPGEAFMDCTRFWGAKMFDTHRLEVKGSGVVLSNTLVVTGPLRWLWIKLVAKNVADTVPDEMQALVRLAQEG